MDVSQPASRPYSVFLDRSAQPFTTRRMTPIRHTFHQHPLMQLERLEQLARSLAATRQCRFTKPGLTVSSEFSHKPESPDGRSLEQVFREIERPGSWVALYDVQTDPVYRDFLAEVMQTVRHAVEPQESIHDIRGFIFISSPPSATPFHIDRENNFWLQIRGRKSLTVWDREDREVVPSPDVESFIVYRSLENVVLKNDFLARGKRFDCGPGDGVYFPSTSPHMTSTEPVPEGGDPVSISIGINFYTNVTRHNAYVHAANGVLRKFGMTPQPPEKRPSVDKLKYPLGRAVIEWRKRVRGYVPTPSFDLSSR
ncbi:cupin [Oxalobacteraceae bacterium OM1]|nr:cupin [Oxalobacteraceae bacterium OM1]